MSMILIFCDDYTSFIYESFVHEEHECDTYDLLKYHKKENVYKNSIGNTELEWGWFILTKEDIESIKNTCWYHNIDKNKSNSLNSYLKEGNIIEVLTHEYIPGQEHKREWRKKINEN